MKINDKYKTLIQSGPEVRYFILTGGRGSSKSYSASTFLTGLTFERGHRILYTRYTMSSAHLSIIPEFLEKIDIMGQGNNFAINKSDITNKLTNDTILFRGIRTSSGNQTGALKSLQGVTTWVLDEAEELLEEETFDKIDLSVRQVGKHNRVIMILNPATKEHWIYKKFFEDRGVEPGFNGVKGDTCYIHTTYLDNKQFLSKSFIDSINLMKVRRPEKYKHQILGGWLNKAEGVVFDNWTLGKFKEVTPSIFGQDYGFSTDPSTLVETSIDKANKKIYIRECYGKQALKTSELFNFNKEYAKTKLIIGDSSEPRLITELKTNGNNIKGAVKGPDSVSYGISLMQDYDLVIDEGSTGIVKELNNYVWSDKKSGKPVDKWNHFIDAIRYAVMYQLVNPNKGNYSIY